MHVLFIGNALLEAPHVHVCVYGYVYLHRLELLEAEEAEQVCLLVYAQNRTIARTAGEFLCTYYFTEELIEAAKKMNVPKGALLLVVV